MLGEIIEPPIQSADQYDQIRDQLGLDSSQAPPGAVAHAAGPVQGGGFRIITVWESAEAAQQWGQKVRAAREALGFEGAPPKVTHFEVHNFTAAPR